MCIDVAKILNSIKVKTLKILSFSANIYVLIDLNVCLVFVAFCLHC